jgi:hypothetical protein
MRTTSRRPGPRLALGILGGVVVLFGLAQLLLPGLAAQRLRDELGRYGHVRSASISAFPAIELLWGHAESATASTGALALTAPHLGELLSQIRGVERVDLRSDATHVGPFAMRRVVFSKRGSTISIDGHVTGSELHAALPASANLEVLGNTPSGVELRVSTTLLGTTPSVEVLLSARNGRVVAQPTGVPFAGMLEVTLLSVPHLFVEGISLGSSPSANGGSGDRDYQLRVTGSLH